MKGNEKLSSKESGLHRYCCVLCTVEIQNFTNIEKTHWIQLDIVK